MPKRTKLSTCQRKRRYLNCEDATAAALAGGWVLRPYRCDRCRQYHLTSRRKGHHTGRAIALRLLPEGAPSGTGAPDL